MTWINTTNRSDQNQNSNQEIKKQGQMKLSQSRNLTKSKMNQLS